MILTHQLDPEGPDLTVGDVAEALGYTDRTMYRYLEDNEFPGAWKTRGQWRIPQRVILKYIEDHTPAD